VSGTQPAEPTTACWETATFNTTTCVWDVTGTQDAEPTTACWETATFDSTSCTWSVSGTQPAEPTTACYETATFDSTSCTWSVSGTQSVPTGMYASNIELTKATMNWSAVSNAHHYDIRMRVQGSSTWTIAINTIYNLSIVKTGLTSSTTYEWEIRSACSPGNSSVSAWSSTQTFTTVTPCTVPVNPVTSGIGLTSATFNWDAVGSAWGYIVRYKRISPNSTGWTYDTVTTNLHSLTTLTSGSTYRWQVKSMCDANGSNNSSWTGTVVFNTVSCNLSLSTSQTDVTCNGGSDGAIDLSVSGASGSYSYDWNNGSTTEDLTSQS
jgi:hypothetical protein